ncbi:MAG: 4Fe-4S binding protein [Candidatus Kapabacteria bacterium]|nr:4Fe-4S binding protein [Ignavibacteriota bacterium]MCW5884446.1 4Fe-4S binding protein [Candidatus Kapabacteria bacterium]
MISEKESSLQIVYTNKAKCLDCNRCVRVCPVKAIRIKNSQAFVDWEKCIVCGNCVNECPQSAKTYRNDIFTVQELLKSDKPTAVIVAPAYAAIMEPWQSVRLASVLRYIGFKYIAEAASFASDVAYATLEYHKESKSSVITSSCPAVVSYVEKYQPHAIGNLAKVKSPMVATAEYLKNHLGNNWNIVFIGPCIAKKYESVRIENRNLFDAVLTFDEMYDLFNEFSIEQARFEESSFDLTAGDNEKLFPALSGFLKAANMKTESFSNEFLSADGIEEIKNIIDYVAETQKPVIVEALFCKHGCINGPGCSTKTNIYQRKNNLINYFNKKEFELNSVEHEKPELRTIFNNNLSIKQPIYTEDEILNVLEKIGKSNPEDRLDCTSCGYDSCRDKAIAVLSGMAEPEMCVSFIRKRSETKADKILQQSPNGIVIVDDNYNIIAMNQAFRKMFMCSNSNIGKPISMIMDPEPFIKFNSAENDKFEITKKYDNFNIICHHIIYSLKEEKKLVGVFVNITNVISNKEKIDSLKKETILKATELLDHQIIMSQRIAKLLGDSTAQSEELINNLLKLTND